MKNWSKKNISGGTILLLSLMIVNVINFVFNAFLGRVLSFEEFGLITLINTFLYIVTVGFNALYATTNYKIAYLTGNFERQKEQGFFKTTLKKTTVISLVISGLWLLAIPFIDNFFKIDNYLVSFFFTPIITLGVITAVDKGFLQGKFRFHYVALVIMAEALSKLLFAWTFVNANLNYWVYLSIPLSTLLAFLLANYLTSQEVIQLKSLKPFGVYPFPKKFFSASLITGIASMAFLTFDVLLVKHFLSPTVAGQYALLSLIGKMVYFFGSLPSALMITFISSDEGNNRDTKKSFYQLFSATLILSIGAFIGIGVLGHSIIPFLFGEKTRIILQYLMIYSAAITLLVIAGTIVSYHLAKRQYIFPIISIVMALFMSLGIAIFHKNIAQVTQVLFAISLVSLVTIGCIHLLETNKILKFSERRFV